MTSTVKESNGTVGKRKGRVDLAKLQQVTEADIATWKHSDGFRDESFGQAHVVPKIDVREIRTQLGLSQEAFAERFMLSLSAIQDWEKHHKEPSDVARVFLYAISRNPEAIAKALE